MSINGLSFETWCYSHLPYAAEIYYSTYQGIGGTPAVRYGIPPTSDRLWDSNARMRKRQHSSLPQDQLSAENPLYLQRKQ